MFVGYRTLLDEKERNQKRDKIRAIGIVLIGGSFFILLLANSSIFFSECEKGLIKLQRTAEIEAGYTIEFEKAYSDYFEECKEEYSLADQIGINQNLNKIINEAKIIEDV
jgi:hypothetical protein